ncbi:hypothetical protein H0H81_007266, partial [Sphagnurus paluster]
FQFMMDNRRLENLLGSHQRILISCRLGGSINFSIVLGMLVRYQSMPLLLWDTQLVPMEIETC